MAKQYNDNKPYAPGSCMMDGYIGFQTSLCLHYNQKSIKQYLKEENQRMVDNHTKGNSDIPRNNTTLILCYVHIQKNVKDTFDNPTAKELKASPVKTRKRVKRFAQRIIEHIKETTDFKSIIDGIQGFNFLTRQKQLYLTRYMKLVPTFWRHPVLSPKPEEIYGSRAKFTYETDGKYYCCEPFPKVEIFASYTNQQWILYVMFCGEYFGRIEVVVNNNVIENPYYLPPGAKYMNENKFAKIGMFARLAIGNRDRTSNQTSEGGFSLDKQHAAGAKKGSRVDIYIQSELEWKIV